MDITAGDIMRRNVVTVAPDASTAEVAGLLSRHSVSALPVCTATGEMLGIVSESDLLRPFRKSNQLRQDWWLNMLAEGYDMAPAFMDYVKADHHQAKDLMTTKVVTAEEDTGLLELAELMASHSVKRIPVLREGRLVGIVSRGDLVKALAASRGGELMA